MLGLSLIVFANGTSTVAAAELPPGPVALVPAPAPLDAYVPYAGQTTCDATVKPGTQYLMNLLLRYYAVGRASGISRACSSGGQSEHKEGRALDWGVNVNNPAEKAAGDRFTEWLTAVGPDGKAGYNARRLGVMYVIWNTRIWSNWGAATSWKPYTGASPHTDHVHVSLSWNGAYMRTSWWTGSAVVGQSAVQSTVFSDDTDPSTIAGLSDITRFALRLDGSTAKATTYLRDWDPTVLSDTAFSAALDVSGDTGPEYMLRKDPAAAGLEGRTVLYRYSSGVPIEVVGCQVTLGSSTAARSISLSVPAPCVGSPNRARLRVFNSRGAGAPDLITDSAPAIGSSPWVSAAPAGPDVPVVPVHRFWSPRFNNAHFFTTSVDEAEQIRTSDANWLYEGQAFFSYVVENGVCPETTPVHRFYSARFQSHFFTASQAERDHVSATDPNWFYEGIAYCASPQQEPGTAPLFRFWSPKFGKHHLTADPVEAAQLDLNDSNWDYEGIAFYITP